MIPAERHQKLLETLRVRGIISVRDACELLGVSHMTVRRDIDLLESQGRVVSVTGGVRLPQRIAEEPSFLAKSVINIEEKIEIAKAARQHVKSGQTIYLDAGTTFGELAKQLTGLSDLTVITNDLTTAGYLVGIPEITLFQIGGRVDLDNRSTVGNMAADMMENFNVDISFISTSSWDLHRGITTPSEPKTSLKQAAMRAAQRSILVADYSKYGNFGIFNVAPLSDFDLVITDESFPVVRRKELLDHGINLEIAASLSGSVQRGHTLQ